MVNENGGGGCVIRWDDALIDQKAISTGKFSSSFIAEMAAIDQALTLVIEKANTSAETNGNFNGMIGYPLLIRIFTDSKSSLQKLSGGPDAQKTKHGVNIWKKV